MNRQVLTYRVPSDLTWKDSKFQKEYNDVLHIAATPTLHESINENLRIYQWLKSPLLTINPLLEEVQGKAWSGQKNQMRQYLEISQILRNRWESSSQADVRMRKHILSFEKNRKELIYTIRLLKELRLDNVFSTLVDKSDEELLLHDIMSEMRDDIRPVEWEKQLLSNPAYFSRIVKEFLQQNSKTKNNLHQFNVGEEEQINDRVEASLSKRKIVLHGFYFITPLQEYFFKHLEQQFELIFVNYYDELLPHTYETVERFLWKDEVPWSASFNEPAVQHPYSVQLLEGIEGRQFHSFKEEELGKVTVYSNMLEFLSKEREVREREKDEKYEHFVSCRGGEIREQLYYAGLIEKKAPSLIDYPIGRFLFELHNLYTEQKTPHNNSSVIEKVLKPDVLQRLFNSGHLYVDGKDGSKINMSMYTKQLDQLLPYFYLGEGFLDGREAQFLTIEEWLEKINFLIEEKMRWESFRPLPAGRVHRLHGRPLEQLSYFKVSIEDMKVIQQGLLMIGRMVHQLFEVETDVRIGEHLEKLKTYVSVSAEEKRHEEEVVLLKDLMMKLGELKDETLKFSLLDIMDGLRFYLQSGLQSYDDEEEMIDKVGALFVADGMAFKQKRNIHLGFTDADALPMSTKYKIWPLSSKTIDELSVFRSELHLFKELKDLSGAITRYLLYTLLIGADDVRISYVRNLETGYDLDMAYYFKVANFIEEPLNLKNEEIDSTEKKDDISLPDFKDRLLIDEANQCPQRATFSYILNDFGTYSSRFHQQLLYKKMLRSVYHTFKNWEKTEMYLSCLYPQLSGAYKKLILQEVKNEVAQYPRQDDRYKIENVSYNGSLKKFRLFYNSPNLTTDSLANPGNHCRFCEFLEICREGHYAIDDEK
ncbi:hypothetical protein [Exiguobacterium sp. CH10]|uniref:hypothetical protein n=1 Tax=Exiguobacterium sp. CH10 TaxID=2751261 RepID=UPI001BE9ED8F|nr:hypothetical protein [Exiguobacterium sp. CH10]